MGTHDAVRRDIHDHGLDPTKPHTVWGKTGRLAKPADVVTEPEKVVEKTKPIVVSPPVVELKKVEVPVQSEKKVEAPVKVETKTEIPVKPVKNPVVEAKTEVKTDAIKVEASKPLEQPSTETTKVVESVKVELKPETKLEAAAEAIVVVSTDKKDEPNSSS